MGYTVDKNGNKVFDDFTWEFWYDVLKQNQRNEFYGREDMPWVHVNSLTVVAGESVYTFYPGIHTYSDRGFGGSKFTFVDPTGKEYVSNDVWHRGHTEDIPPTILEKFSPAWTIK